SQSLPAAPPSGRRTTSSRWPGSTLRRPTGGPITRPPTPALRTPASVSSRSSGTTSRSPPSPTRRRSPSRARLPRDYEVRLSQTNREGPGGRKEEMFKTSKVTLRTAQRHLGARDLLDAYEILWAAEV